MTALDMVAPYQVDWRPWPPEDRRMVRGRPESSAGAAPLASRV